MGIEGGFDKQKYKREMLLQGRIAEIVFDIQHQGGTKEGYKHSDAMMEWGAGDDDKHVPAHYFHEILREKDLDPEKISLNDEATLKMLAQDIVKRFEIDAYRDENETLH